MGSTVQYSIVQYSTIQYSTVIYCTVLYCNVLYSTVLYCTVLYRTVLYYTVLYCTILYSTILYCTVLYIGNHSGNDYFGFITANFLEINKRGDSRVPEEDEEIRVGCLPEYLMLVVGILIGHLKNRLQ